ncbi:hypothetical protein [Rahnella sp. NRRL B-41462]|uniref:hypothetical protein n=1 Tax=Rahnella sp. NRRL B-41462 TaxID=1610579 RepID=UPI000DD40AAE|nr:hypothetical protein [Rahnella sp. NRRL B-41462]
MSESTELVIVEPKNALTVFTAPDEIEAILLKVEQEVGSFVPDVSTKKGRDAIGSLGLKIAKTKTYLDGLGKDLVDEYKEIPKKIDANRKTVRDRLDALKAKTLKPREEWEAEQENIRLAKLAEADHEIALLMNEKFDRAAADAKAEAERQRTAHEEDLKRQAVEQALREADERIQREREASAKREADLKAQAEQAERDRIALAQKAEQDRIDAANKAEADRLAAAQQAEREKQEAIAAQQLKAKQEADRIQREAKQKEDARLAEEKRIADEAAARAANEAHRKAIGTDVVNALVAHAGLTRVQAIDVLMQIKDGNIPHTTINY